MAFIRIFRFLVVLNIVLTKFDVISSKLSPLQCDFHSQGQLCEYQADSPENLLWGTDFKPPSNLNRPFIQLISGSVTLNSTISYGHESTTCLAFDYFLFGGSGAIKLVKKVFYDHTDRREGTYGWNVLFEVDQNKGTADKWYHFEQTMTRLNNRTLFELTMENESGTDVRLSNITVSAAACQQDEMSCNFDTGHGFHANCRFLSHNESNSNYRWHNTEVHGQWNRPVTDHSMATEFGRYLSTEPRSVVDIGTEAQLVTPAYAQSEAHCFTFWFYKPRGLQSDALRVLDGSGNVLWRAMSTSDEWQFAARSVVPSERVIISAIRTNATSLPAMIDDVRMFRGPCPRTVSCSFASDLCGWTFSKYIHHWQQGRRRILGSSANISQALLDGSNEDEMFMYANTAASGAAIHSIQSDFTLFGGNYELEISFFKANSEPCDFGINLVDIEDKSDTIYRMPAAFEPVGEWTEFKVYFRHGPPFRLSIDLINRNTNCFFAFRNLVLTKLQTRSKATPAEEVINEVNEAQGAQNSSAGDILFTRLLYITLAIASLFVF